MSLCAISDAAIGVVLCCTPFQHCETIAPPHGKAPVLDFVWFMTNMFPVQVTHASKCYIILCIVFFLFFDL